MGKIIRRYQKPHDEGQGGTNIITYNVNVGGASSDGNFTTIRANRADIDEIHAKNIEAENINATVHLMASDGTIQHISGQDLEYMTGRINTLSTSNLTVDEQATIKNADIKNLIADYINAKKIDTVDLTVTGTAHFFELIIDKINSVEGTIINTAAHCKADYVEQVDENGNTRSDYADEHDGDDTGFTPTRYRIYWRKDQDGAARTNNWLEHDQAISKSFNKATVGTNYNISNTNYWRLVVGKNPEGDRTWINFDTGKKRYTEPDDKIHFLGFSWSRPQDENVYADTQTEWTVTGQGQSFGLWTPDEENDEIDASGAGKLLAQQTLLGIEIIPTPDETEPPLVKWGTFSFETEKPCKINVGFLYDDGTVEYFPADDYETSYNFELTYDAAVERIIITAATIEQWNECWWIDLSDTYDSNNPLESGKTENSTVPQVGDVISQLGYRYQYLDGYVNTDEWREKHATAVARASAIIIAAYETPDTGITPPSYAQYQYITNFELISHRGTYFDASGAHFKGTLEAGTQVDPGTTIDVNVETWKLQTQEDPIMKNSTAHVRIFHNENGVGTVISDDSYIQGATGMRLYRQNNGTGSDSRITSLTQTIGNINSVRFTLKDNNDITKDVLYSTVIDLGEVTDGENGDFTEIIYKAGGEATGPAMPASLTIKFADYTPAEKDGWVTNLPSTTVNNKYIWMAQRNITYSGQIATWGAWTGPMRITGADGADGTAGADGRDYEYIYQRTATGIAPALYNNGADTSYWPTAFNSGLYHTRDSSYTGFITDWKPNASTSIYSYQDGYDYLPPSGAIEGAMFTDWHDHPEGVTGTLPYEWMSQRIKTNGTWSEFTSPVLWSKYGQNGTDGDGVEYIFKTYANEKQTWSTSDNWNPATWNASQEDDYTGPTGYKWSDDPVSVSATAPYEYVSQRKSDDGIWGIFSTPTLWAKWGKDGDPGQPGSEGATGATGPQGNDGESWTLAPISRIFEVRIDRDPNGNARVDFDGLKGALYTDLKYAVYHTVGAIATMIGATDLGQNYKLEITANNGLNTQKTSSTTGTKDSIDYLNYTKNNFLTEMGASGSYANYYYDAINNETNYIVTQLNVQLLKKVNGTYVEVKDAKDTVPLVFKPDHDFVVGDAALSSVYQGLCGATGAWKESGFSSLLQNWKNINLTVNNIKNLSAGGLPTSNDEDHYIYLTTRNATAPATPSASWNSIDNSGSALNTWYKTPYICSGTGIGYVSEQHATWNIVDGTNVYTFGDWSKPVMFYKIENGIPTYYQSVNTGYVDVKAEEVSIGVRTQVEGELSNTGIDITNGKIKLQGDKVIFANSSGGATGNIWIDSTNGTLHAINGDFSGTINATNSTFSGTVTATDGTFNGIVKATTLYSEAYNIPNNVTSIRIGTDNSGKIYTQYLRQGGSSDIDIYLPNPEDYPGLEIGFLFFTSADLNIDEETDITNLKSIVIHRANATAANGGYYLRAKTKSFVPATYNHQNSSLSSRTIYYGYASQAQTPANMTQLMLDTIIPTMKFVDYVKIAPNTLTKFKAIASRWYQIEGNNIDGSTPKDYDSNDPRC